MRKRHAGREDSAHDGEKKSELHIELLDLAAELDFFLVAGIGDDGDADQGHENAGHGQQAAVGGEQHGALAVEERRHQCADDQRDADGNADAKRHAQVAHGEAVAHVADAPHGAEQSNFEEQGRTHGGVESGEVGQQNRLTPMGSRIQEKKPAMAQVVSHDQFRTLPMGA